MIDHPAGFPCRAAIPVAPGSRGLTRLFACLDESGLKSRYAFGRYADPERSDFELFFKDETDAALARAKWDGCREKTMT